MKAYENQRMTDWAIKQVGNKMGIEQAREGPFHASEIYSCHRKVFKNRTEPRTFSAETILKFALGFAMQEWFFGAEDDGVIMNEVVYSPDKIFDADNVGEFKTTRRSYEKYDKTGGKTDKTKPKVRFDVMDNESWIDRTGAYCAEFGINKAHILVFFLYSNELHAWTLEFTDAELAAIRVDNAGRRDALQESFDKATKTKKSKPPSVTTRTADWECEWCPYFEGCLTELIKDGYVKEE